VAGNRERVAEIAEQVCKWYAGGDRGKHRIGLISIELTDTGYCSEFVRECCEAAAETPDHGPLTRRYFGADAKETERKLSGAGKATTTPQRGDIVCFNKKTGRYGHIGILLGKGKFAENTSSRSRGPGFVISRLGDMAGRVSGYYSIMPGVEETGGGQVVQLVVHGSDPPEVVASVRVVPDGDHIADQGKLYIEKPEWVTK